MADLKSLQEEFPDVSQSTLGDILNAYKNDASKVKATLKGEEEREQKKKISELKQMFSTLPEDVIVRALKTAQWEVDDAIIPLLHEKEEREREERKKEQQKTKKRREEEEKKKEENKRQRI